MKRIVVVGGGISGLAAAWAAAESAGDVPGGLEVTVVERDAQVGGKAQSIQRDGWLVEAGPTACYGDEPVMQRLIAAGGLEPQRVQAAEASKHRFIVRGGRMREVHANPLRFARSGILGLGGMLRLASEPFIRARKSDEDETVWEFARRRIGSQAADRLIAPMVLGVFAGDARELSLPAAFPKLATLEREHGSLFKGMRAKRKVARAGGPAGRGGNLVSFERGIQSLPIALARSGAFTVRTGTEVQAVTDTLDGRHAVVLRGAETIPADAVILAGEPWACGELVTQRAPRLAQLLNEIPCPPLAVVALGYGEASFDRVPRGFGTLIPRGEGYRILGCLWDTHLFPGRSPQGKLLVRAMIGGTVDPEAARMEDRELFATVREELRRLMNLDQTPEFEHIARWPRAIPQYELGHLKRVALVEDELARMPGLFVAGNGLYGTAFDKAAEAGLDAARRAIETLSENPSPAGAARA